MDGATGTTDSQQPTRDPPARPPGPARARR